MRVERTFAFVDLSGFTNYTAEHGDARELSHRAARRSGWMCRCGIKLEVQDADASCPVCAKRYLIHGGALAPV